MQREKRDKSLSFLFAKKEVKVMEEKKKMCISISEMANLLGIGLTSAYKLANSSGFYPAKRVCGRIVIHYDLLGKWITEQNN